MDNNILSMIRKTGKLSKFDLSKLCGYSISTTISIVDRLFAERKIIKLDTDSLTVGRPAVYYSINPSAGLFVGVEMYYDDIVCTAMDFLCVKLVSVQKQIRREQMHASDLIKTMAEAIREVLEKTQIEKPNVFAVGVSIPGMIDNVNGHMLYTKQFPALDGLNISQALEERINLPVFVDDVVKSMCLACKWLYYDSLRDNIALLYIRRGIQISYIFNNELMRGENNLAGEMGHMPTHMGNHPCYCGKKGCFVAEASEQAIISKLRYGLRFNGYSALRQCVGDDDENVTFDTFIDFVLKEDAEVMNLFHEVCEFYSMIINQIMHYYDPKRIYLCGSICKIGVPLLSKLYDSLESDARRTVDPPEIVLMTEPIDGGHAAACMAMDNIYSVINHHI